MIKLDLDNYLKLKIELKKVFEHLVSKNNEIEIIIYDLSEILKENLFIKDAKIIFDFIKDRNTYDHSQKESLIELMENLYFDLLTNYKINLYFYGNDKLNYLNDTYLNISLNNLDNYYEGKNIYNILILENKEIEIENYKFDKIYDYYEIFEIVKNYCLDIYDSKTSPYEYYYLKHELCSIKNEFIDTLITGISYTLHAVKKELLLNKSYSLALGSQDLYYAYKIARNGIIFNKNIKRCVIGIGYYSLYFDTSLSGAKSYCPMVYEKLINDLHNFYFNSDEYNKKFKKHNIKYENLIKITFINRNNPTVYQSLNLKNISGELVINDIFNFDNLQEYILYSFYNKYKSYYNKEFNKCDDKIYNNSTFYESSLQNKMEVSKSYANHHNRHIKHKKTREENLSILNEFLRFLNENSVEPIIVVFPFTKYYNEMLNPYYKIELENTIDEFKKIYDFKFIDLNNYEFDDTEFFDQDHLNEKGAVKATKYINELIY